MQIVVVDCRSTEVKTASIGNNTIVVDDDCLGRIDFRGYNTNGNSYDQGATIEARV